MNSKENTVLSLRPDIITRNILLQITDDAKNTEPTKPDSGIEVLRDEIEKKLNVYKDCKNYVDEKI